MCLRSDDFDNDYKGSYVNGWASLYDRLKLLEPAKSRLLFLCFWSFFGLQAIAGGFYSTFLGVLTKPMFYGLFPPSFPHKVISRPIMDESCKKATHWLPPTFFNFIVFIGFKIRSSILHLILRIFALWKHNDKKRSGG